LHKGELHQEEELQTKSGNLREGEIEIEESNVDVKN
jgi:hypothetical protein